MDEYSLDNKTLNRLVTKILEKGKAVIEFIQNNPDPHGVELIEDFQGPGGIDWGRCFRVSIGTVSVICQLPRPEGRSL